MAKGVSDHQQCAFEIDPLHFVAAIFGTFAMEANSNSIFEHLFGKASMKTKSNKMLSSNCCFLFEKCAREAASLGDPGHVQSLVLM